MASMAVLRKAYAQDISEEEIEENLFKELLNKGIVREDGKLKLPKMIVDRLIRLMES